MSMMPKGERVREHLKTDPSRAVMPLVYEAALKFDLTPKESEELSQFYRSARECESDSGA
jgi:hypothetical protein